MKRLYLWLMNGGPDDPKHRGWLHPFVTGILTIAVTLSCMLGLSRYLSDKYQLNWEINDSPRVAIGIFIFCYYLFLICGRATFMSTCALYDMLWTCNMTLLNASLGFLLKEPVLMASAFSTILVDQMLWYIDVIGFIFLRKWVVGVAKYLTWKETPLLKKLTSTHHIWFVPLCLSQLNNLGYPTVFLWAAVAYSFILAFCSRFFTPLAVNYPVDPHKSDDPSIVKSIYLNVNLCHEVWPDLKKWKLLTLFENASKKSPFLLVNSLIFLWNVLNFPWFFLIQLIFFYSNFTSNFT